ncbi:MAG TPA: pantoate--beta-alanine ligase [Rudaea sp.]|nr:pantoate--beta-alanine ligase [Rudaea sp.]
MESVTTAAELREHVAAWRRDGARVGFVPTLGNLHAGHYSLVSIARANADRVVASVFVNPTQFGPREDFASYPRTIETDRVGLEAHGCDLLFAPGIEEVYPFGADASVRVDVPAVSATLEGALRPGHFTGVATVVTKLLNLVQPDVAIFGQKDYQQLLVIKRLVRDLALPIRIVAAPTMRESNGLAMSSRNQYLSADERQRAGAIHRTLVRMCEEVRAGKPRAAIEDDALRALEGEGLAVDYAVLRRSEDLTEPPPRERHGLIALIAAKLGRARLIDNLSADL